MSGILNNQETVDCPACCRKIKTSVINWHLDNCLEPQSEKEIENPAKRQCTEYSPETNNLRFSGPNRLRLEPEAETRESETEIENEKVRPQATTSKLWLNHANQDSKSIESAKKSILKFPPLADVLRPSYFEEYEGQENILSEGSMLRTLIEVNNIPSMILWGPPGCGKDSLLPHVENGTIILIGATTENPSFVLNSTLLSRCRVVVFQKLSEGNIMHILARALKHLNIEVLDKEKENATNFSSSSGSTMCIENKALEMLAAVCDGDARTALNSLQMTVESASSNCVETNNYDCPHVIKVEHIKEGLQRSHLLYDRKGDQHYDTISAYIKSMRGSDENASLYWLARLLEGGEDPRFIARRLIIFASEDVGIADSNALNLAVSIFHSCQFVGMPESRIMLAHCTAYMSRAAKSREVYSAYCKAEECVREHQGPLPPVPIYLRNAPTKLMKEMGYGKRCGDTLPFLPEGLEGVNFFQ
ncbi:ATPase WRNIP1-like [Limulus polyphemus]|uniref:ATPase WRNIP1-like n=1 Tax=Limulus polyphemus TaxID=6850 RepID=A0ABM1TAD2_LIMPO|nr:ATPase WRNIP1-like [Limulus polyphemus]